MVVSTLDQARMFLADQPIEGPGEPRKTLQLKTGQFTIPIQDNSLDSSFLDILEMGDFQMGVYSVCSRMVIT